MKPLQLDMQAFGPFAHCQAIDFRALGDKTFFLIHGPTGSGKTTILDGMCYALFGDSSGGEREGKQMRSHHADADTLTEVRFDFRLGAEHYRVRRAPEQMRRAKRGGGETKQAQQAELWRIENPGSGETAVPTASGWTEVTKQITQLLGFESRQFRQVIMLPQGKFRDFLMSNTQDRERILQTLFGTELYKRIEEALKRAAADLEKEADKARTQRQTLLEQAEALNEEVLGARVEEQQLALAARQAEEATAKAAATQTESALAQARLVEARFVERDAAQRALEALQAQQPSWQIRRLQLAAARKAALIRPYAMALETAEKEITRLAGERTSQAEAVDTATRGKAAAEAAFVQAHARSPEIDAAVARLAELDALSAKVTALATSREELAEALKAQTRADTAQERTGQAVTVRQGELKKLQETQQLAQVRAATQAGHRAVLDRLTAQLTQRQALDAQAKVYASKQALLVAATSRRTQAQEASTLARSQRDQTYQFWVAGQAARLAHALTDGEPCPVCGATAHPSPAHGNDNLVQDDALNAAEAAWTAAETTLREAEHALAEARTAESLAAQRREDLNVGLAEAANVPVAELEAQRKEAEAQCKQATEAVNWLAQAENLAAAAQRNLSEAESAHQTAQGASTAARERVQSLTVQVTERVAGVPPTLAEPKALAEERKRTQRTLDQLRQALAEATTKVQASATQLTEATTRLAATAEQCERQVSQLDTMLTDLNQRLAAAGFAELSGYRTARMADEAVAALDEQIQGFDASLKAAGERLERARAGTAEGIRPDVAGMTSIHEQAKTAHLAAAKAVQDASSALAHTQKFLTSLIKLNQSFADLEARYGLLRHVADVANGNNPQRMSFQRYVLATLLEEVLAATTVRLRVMSRGRYEMRRKNDPVDQRSAAGLDLEIFDHYTGTTRAVSTLSGGESFLASLALALGLSDVVQSYAGGIRLDAIFVDEGFGTLDPESLDFAIRALKDLQQAGRLVGIISHVAELKEWIDARLELKAAQTGSAAEFVG